MSQHKVSLVLLASLLAQGAHARTYTVQKGDTLSEIVEQELGTPIWGSKGNLKRVLNNNPDIQNPDLIYPGQKVVIIKEDRVQTVDVAEVDFQEAKVEETFAAAPLVKRSSERLQNQVRMLFITSDSQADVYGESKDYSSELRSNANFGSEIAVTREIIPGTSFGGYFKAMTSSYDKSEDGRFGGQDDTLKSLGLIVEHQFNRQVFAYGKFGVEQALFTERGSESSLAMEPVYLDNVTLGAGYNFIVRSSYSLGLAAKGHYAGSNSGDTITAKDGFVYGGEFLGSKSFAKHYQVLGSIFFDKRVQDSQNAVQESQEQGVKIGISYQY